MKTFINANLVLPGEILYSSYLQTQHGKISGFGSMDGFVPPQSPENRVINCEGKYLSPGFIDMHTHGAGGHDFMDGTTEAYLRACQTHLSHGTTSLLPTTITCSDEDLYKSISAFHGCKACKENMPHLLGLHLEGPYFASSQKGAQPDEYILQPKPEHYNKIMDYARGSILRWTVAPELPGALQMANELSKQGVLMAIGHSDATLEEVKAAIAAGFTHITHFYSGMSTIKRVDGMRILGIIESGYLFDELSVEIIADGMHLPPDLLKLIVKCKNQDLICLVTDSMRGAGMPDGASVLGSLNGGQEVIIEDGVAKMPDRSCFAGSVATADRLIRVMTAKAGLSLPAAVKMMSLTPAKILKIDKQKGSIAVGKDADLIVFDENINVSQVYVSN